jgi:uncharacterized protein
MPSSRARHSCKRSGTAVGRQAFTSTAAAWPPGARLMKALNVLTLMVVILGALNWGLLGLFQVDLIAALFGGPQTALSRFLYILVGVSGIYQLIPLVNALSSDVENAQEDGLGLSGSYTPERKLDR